MRLRAIFAEPHHLCQASSVIGVTVPSNYLDYDVRHVQLGMDHEIQAAEAFIGFVDAVNQVGAFQTGSR